MFHVKNIMDLNKILGGPGVQMGYGLYQEQTMKLVMTPELRQAITILQFSALDLIDYIHEQMNENPVLEPMNMELAPPVEAKHELSPPDIDWTEYVWARAQGDYSIPAIRSAKDDYDPIDWVSGNEISLDQHLLEQLAFIRGIPLSVRKVCEYMIGNINEKGYLELSLDHITTLLKVDLEEAEQALFIVQSLEPRGVGARDLQECLQIQLEYAGEKQSLAYRIVSKHLSDLAEGKWNKIGAELRVSLTHIQEAIDLIRTLNPRPGSRYQQHVSNFIIPDATVELVEGEYIVLVNDTTSPQLRISRFYKKLLQQEGHVKKYVHDKMNAALWLIKSIEQRKATIYRVTKAIVEKQREFFEKGVACLKPMTLKEIAQMLELHESTISRATHNKYVQTPRGMFELKYFFSSGLSTSTGDATSSESVKARMKELIQQENRKKPLSDQKICEQLQAEGISISRRTVAKYREELGILPSVKRKRYS